MLTHEIQKFAQETLLECEEYFDDETLKYFSLERAWTGIYNVEQLAWPVLVGVHNGDDTLRIIFAPPASKRIQWVLSELESTEKLTQKLELMLRMLYAVAPAVQAAGEFELGDSVLPESKIVEAQEITQARQQLDALFKIETNQENGN